MKILPVIAFSSADNFKILGTFRVFDVAFDPLKSLIVDDGGSKTRGIRWITNFQLATFF